MSGELRSRRSTRTTSPRTTSRRPPAVAALTGEQPPIAFAKPGTPEWFVAWQGLGDASGDPDREAFDERSGEVWQYMGSALREFGWVHEFRHSNHPSTQDRWLLSVLASPDWKPEEVLR